MSTLNLDRTHSFQHQNANGIQLSLLQNTILVNEYFGYLCAVKTSTVNTQRLLPLFFLISNIIL